MKKNLLFIFVILLCISCGDSQTVNVKDGVASVEPVSETVLVKGKITPADKADGALIYVSPISVDNDSMVTAVVEGADFKAEVGRALDGFYNLILIRNQSQAILPFFVPNVESVDLELSLSDAIPVIKGSKDNDALSVYSNFVYSKDKELWTESAKILPGDMKGFLNEYISKAESVVKEKKCNSNVADYIRLWGYVSAYNSFNSYLRISGNRADEMPFALNDIMANSSKLLDSSVAPLFTGVQQIVLSTLPKNGDLSAKIEYLRTNYKNEKIRGSIENVLLEGYITRFNYSEGYDEGYALLKSVVEKYNFDSKYLADFEKRRATVKGAAFPEGVVLKDAEGNTVDFKKFRGKYVYIDLWASWCVPCVKEVPHLQKLEAELKNKDVVFLSISVDAKEEPWKAKMKQLDMHGNQLHDKENKICDNLNVKGIPFFLIYDKEGKLYMYDAPRPSHPGLKILLEELK